jgi:hypothetical protein
MASHSKICGLSFVFLNTGLVFFEDVGSSAGSVRQRNQRKRGKNLIVPPLFLAYDVQDLKRQKKTTRTKNSRTANEQTGLSSSSWEQREHQKPAIFWRIHA